MKILLTALMGMTVASTASAQSLPPACEKYVVAIETCLQNQITGLDASSANSAREMLKSVADGKETLRKKVAERGSDAVTEICTAPAYVQNMKVILDKIVTPLVFAKVANKQVGLNNQCRTAINRINSAN